jgi:GPI ethanolamine phosphate transferase 1
VCVSVQLGPCALVNVVVDHRLRIGLASLSPFCSFFFTTTAPRTAEGRLLTYFLSFCPCFVVLSISAEGLFYVSYCTTLYLWTLVEEDARLEKTKYRAEDGESESGSGSGSGSGFGWNPRRLKMDDVRIALFFLFFVQVGFFGTGK